MSAPRCSNPRCNRELKPDGPSMLYCNHSCATFNSFNYESINRDLVYGQHGDTPDPTQWPTRSASPVTASANVTYAYSWLDVRADQ